MPSDLFDMTGKVAVVTGAGANGGLGHTIALGFAQYGADIVAGDIDDAGAQTTVAEVKALGRQAIAVKCDVASEASVAAMAKEVGKKFSNVDIVVNCAGIFPQKNFPEMTFASCPCSSL